MTSLLASDPGSAAAWNSKRINPRPQFCLCLTWSGYPSNDNDVHPGPVLLRRFVRNKYDLLVDKVELLDTNLSFANVRLRSGNKVTVSVSDLAPCLSTPIQTSEDRENISNPTESFPNEKTPFFDVSKTSLVPTKTTENSPAELSTANTTPSISPVSEDV